MCRMKRTKLQYQYLTNNLDPYTAQFSKVNWGTTCDRAGEKTDIIHKVNLAPGTNTRSWEESKHHKKRVTPNREKKEWELWVNKVLLLTWRAGKQTNVWASRVQKYKHPFHSHKRLTCCSHLWIRMNCCRGSKIFARNHWGTYNQHSDILNFSLEGKCKGKYKEMIYIAYKKYLGY